MIHQNPADFLFEKRSQSLRSFLNKSYYKKFKRLLTEMIGEVAILLPHAL